MTAPDWLTPDMPLGEIVRRAREAKGITLRQLGAAVGVSVPFLSDLEHGGRGTDKLQALADALGLDVTVLARARLHRTLNELVARNPELAELLRMGGSVCPWCQRYDATRTERGKEKR